MAGYRIIEVHEAATDPDGTEPSLTTVLAALEKVVGATSQPPKPKNEPTAWDEAEPATGLPQGWQFAAAWRVDVEKRRSKLANELARLGELTESQIRERQYLRALLDDAKHASQAKVRLKKWWWGTEIERAWGRLHEVEERVVDLLPASELESRANDALAHANRHLKSDDKRVLALESLRSDVVAGKKSPEVLRPAVRDVLRASHDKSDHTNVESRYLRNRLVLASIAWITLAVAALIVQRGLTDHAFLEPNGVLADKPTTYLFLVLIFGAVGALFTAVPTFTQIPSDLSPFNLPLQQAVLKVAVGPLVALVGFAIVNTVDTTNTLNISRPDSLSAVLLLAVIFGAAQHLVTRFVDHRAGEILADIAPDETK